MLSISHDGLTSSIFTTSEVSALPKEAESYVRAFFFRSKFSYSFVESSVSADSVMLARSSFVGPVTYVVTSFTLVRRVSASGVRVFSIVCIAGIVAFRGALQVLARGGFSPFYLFCRVCPCLSGTISFGVLLLFVFRRFRPRFLSIFLSLIFFQ